MGKLSATMQNRGRRQHLRWRTAKQTPYLGANHPIAAVYQKCEITKDNIGIVAMERQDLATSCFAGTMGKTA